MQIVPIFLKKLAFLNRFFCKANRDTETFYANNIFYAFESALLCLDKGRCRRLVGIALKCQIDFLLLSWTMERGNL